MARKIKICAVTSTRADWGLLLPLLRAIRDDGHFELKLAVTGQHLDPSAGATNRAIRADGFKIDAKVDMKLTNDTPTAVNAALGRAVAGFGQALAKMKPDLLFVLGDRYEILGAVTAATIARVPVVHNCGGDLTEGAVDEGIRHAISKLSHIHFVTNAASRRRVCQMGENPRHVVTVGSSGIELLRTMRLMTRKEFFTSVDLDPRQKAVIVTFHPETLAPGATVAHCREMLAALERLPPDIGLLFCGTNADMEGRDIDALVKRFVGRRDNAVFHASLGSRRYLSALKHCDAVIGNSSSGIYEAPSLATPTVNIGDRQKGRLRAASVIDVIPDRRAIHKAIVRALAMDCRGVKNPYGNGKASAKMTVALKKIMGEIQWDTTRLLRKPFFPAGER